MTRAALGWSVVAAGLPLIVLCASLVIGTTDDAEGGGAYIGWNAYASR